MGSGLLFVSPYPQDAVSLAQMLDDASLDVIHVQGLKDAASKLETGNFQVVVTEANLEDGTWLDLLELTRSLGTELVYRFLNNVAMSLARLLRTLPPASPACTST